MEEEMPVMSRCRPSKAKIILSLILTGVVAGISYVLFAAVIAANLAILPACILLVLGKATTRAFIIVAAAALIVSVVTLIVVATAHTLSVAGTKTRRK